MIFSIKKLACQLQAAWFDANQDVLLPVESPKVSQELGSLSFHWVRNGVEQLSLGSEGWIEFGSS